MKALKYIGIILLVLLIIFLSFGLLTPTVHYGHEISVNKPLKEAWAVPQDPMKFDQWLAGFKSIELISGEQNELGSKYKVVVSPDGQEDFEMIETLIAHDEYEYIEMDYDSDMMVFKQKIFFTGDDKSATIRTDNTVTGKGIFMRSMFAVMGKFGSFQAQEEENIDNLKSIIEANTTDYYPEDSSLETMEGAAVESSMGAAESK